MKNKKGFVFVETIVVCSVLSVSLVMIYAAFVSLIQNQKQRIRYDQLVYNYRVYNVAKVLYTNETLGECDDSFKSIEDSNLKEAFKYESLYYVSYNGVKSGSVSNKNNLGAYLKTIKPESNDTCLLIGEFPYENPQTKKIEYYYSYVEVEKGA